MDDNERRLREAGDRRSQEAARVEGGDGKLRLWSVDVMWIGGDDIPGTEEQRGWASKGALDVQRVYILVCIDLGLIVSVGRRIGTQNKQTWIVRARSRTGAEAVARMSPLGELGMLEVLESRLPVDPVALSPEAAKICAVEQYHPVVEKVMNGMTFEQMHEWIDADEPHDSGRTFKMIIVWEWFRKVDRVKPGMWQPGFLEAHWERLVISCACRIAVLEAEATLRVANANARRTGNLLAEWGVDVEELRRRRDEAQAMGLTLDPEDIPLKEEFLRDEGEDGDEDEGGE